MKKAMILYYPILVGFVVGLAFFYVGSLKANLPGETNYVGEIALNHLKASKDAERTLSYIEYSAKQAAYQSIYNAGLKGGFYSEPECGSLAGYTLWNSELKECYPNINISLNPFLKNNLNLYLSINENTLSYVDNYDFLLKDDNNKSRVIGIATLPITVPISVKVDSKTQKQIGNYSIKPSFEHIIDYNLKDYDTIEQKSVEIASICEKEGDIKGCVERNITELNKFHKDLPTENPLEWYIGSPKPIERFFYDFADRYESCLNSTDNGCRCDFKLDYKDPAINGTYAITISKEGSNTKLELTQPADSNLIYSIKNTAPSVINGNINGVIQQPEESLYSVSYSKDGVYKSASLTFPMQTFDFTKGARLYKTIGNRIVFIGEDSTDYQNIRECSIPNIYRFTVVNENNKFFVYDNTLQKSEFKPIEIRFAINIKDLPPPQVEGLTVQDEQKAEGAVLLRWKKSSATDAATYIIYYSQSDFITQQIIAHKIKNPYSPYVVNSLENSINIPEQNIYERISSSVTYDKDKRIWGHIVSKRGIRIEKLIPNQLYYATETGEYLLILNGLEDNKNYYFALTAVDRGGNEINNKPGQNLELNKNYVSAKPIDDLAPNKVTNVKFLSITDSNPKTIEFSFLPPTTNEDGSSIKETSLSIYVYPVVLVPTESCTFESIMGKLAGTYPRSMTIVAPFSTIQRVSIIPSFGQICFAFILKDTAKNPLLESANIQDLVVTSGPYIIS